ncbi:MAG TPA: GEVED domain-containing protein [Sedimentisphaerales bacterium]|nr:GEVED domain-containing protein [Sedimentisphaerales bacterium]
MTVLRKTLLSACVLAVFLGAAPAAMGDWDEGDSYKMHYPQLPKEGGWDVAFNQGRLADDWGCTETGPVTDIHFWVSWESDDVWPIDGFSARIWSNNPMGQFGWSEPNELQWERDFAAGEFTVRDMQPDLQGWFDPYSGYYNPQDHVSWQQINIVDIADPFVQEEGTVYWLEIDMWGTGPTCGWKQSGEQQFRDDAVVWDSPYWMELRDPETGDSLDLAFVITSEPDLDFGDAPDYWPVGGGYPTLSGNNGANHIIGGPWLGDTTDVPDPEPDGQPDAAALGDDMDTVYPPANDDEDGVTIPVLVQGQTANITFEVSGGGGQVNIWIDWNGDMDWSDAGEKVEDNWYGNGIWSVAVTPPLGSVIGQTFLRARISTDGSLPPGGAATDGEVEDHEVSIEQAPEELDFGDAPDPNYPTLLASNGARHIITPGPHFCAVAGGGVPDPEPDGQPDPQALGDDNDGNDDEDGVTFPTLVQWVPANILVNVCDNGAGGGGIVQIWIDFNGNGGWETGEQIFNGPLPVGVHNVPVTAPIGSVVGTTFARCRISSLGGLRPDGLANDGEVEDYTVDIEENPTIKWAQLPDTSPNGIDIKVTGQWLADDFECTSYGPITDVHLWCSWKYDDVGEITNLHLSFHSDDPVGPGGSDPCNEYSKPNGEPLWERDFPPSEFSMTAVKTVADGEWWWDPQRGDLIFPGDFTIWRIDVNIPADEAFLQDGDPCNPVIYWMDVRADVEGELTELGWKTRRFPEHFADDAVFHWGELPFFWRELRYPEDHPYYPNSIDMAFVLTGEEWERPKEPVPHLKWSQPPIEWDPTLTVPLYCGWDQESWTVAPDTYWLAVADDFRCLGTMPVASVHWYGSYIGWLEDVPPDPRPSAWRIGFWSNIPANPTGDPPYSHPGTLLWQVEAPANRVEIQWIGKDLFPDMPLETCFQYYVKFEPDEYFWQGRYVTADTPDDVFWISIAAIYPTGTEILYPWGWKTRPWSWMDDAVTFEHWGPLEPGVVLDPWLITPIENPYTLESMDVAFELDTDPCYIKWEQPFTGIRHWPHYEDVVSMMIDQPVTEYKWRQEPDPMGWDVCVSGWRLADDWLCNQTGPVSDIHFWISSERDQPFEIMQIDVEIYSDSPAVPPGHSEPNILLWRRSFVPGEFDVLPYGQGDQGWLEPDGFWQRPDHTQFSLININYIPDPHWQNEGTIYWLSIRIVAMGHVGWKTTMNHWNDDAVYQYPDGTGWGAMTDPQTGQTIDLAFALTTQKDVDLRALVADDWRCDSNSPVTALAWWGSYLGYQYEACQGLQTVPPVKPDYFQLAIWDDVPADACDPTSYSHPNNIIWEYKTRNYDEVLVGYDKHPHGDPNEPVFRYSVKLPRENWFFQRDVNAVYWLSVLAVWDVNRPNYDWGWTNHKHVYNDDAVSGYMELDPSGMVNWIWNEVFDQTGASADMSFILFTDPDCLNRNAPEYADWVLLGRPKCWCFARQCRGDIDGKQTGPFWVAIPDLGLFKPCFNQAVLPPGCICADLDHLKTGPFRVAIPDLAIFKTYFNQVVVPPCDQLPIYTGPYNYWTSP